MQNPSDQVRDVQSSLSSRPRPTRVPLPRRRSRVGLITRALISEETGGIAGDCSPNSICNIMNPIRSQLGLQPMRAPDFDWERMNQNCPSVSKISPEILAAEEPEKATLDTLPLPSSVTPPTDTPQIPLPAKEPENVTADSSATRPIETPNSYLNSYLSDMSKGTQGTRDTGGNEQNIAPKSGPLPPPNAAAVAVRIPASHLKRAVSSAGFPNSSELFSSAAKLNSSGPINRRINNTEPRTPILGPPQVPSALSTHSKSAKKSTGSGWKFASEKVLDKEYLVLKELGKGGCGQVSLVMEKVERKLYAMKKVNLNGLDRTSIQECINEVTMLVELKDSELVIHIESWELNEKDNTIKIIMEYGQCDLNNSTQSSRVSYAELKFIWERLLKIVEVIHSRGIVHADLKPANFVWVGVKLKIIDFGISNKIQADHTSIAMFNPKGTLNFISPETIRPDALGRTKMGPKSDIWSLGCILYQLVYGKTPFQDITHQVAKINAILAGQIPYPPLPPHLVSSSVISVLKSCFEMDSRKRPTATELLQQPFISGNFCGDVSY